ncbi:hypothetical protein AV530_018440 [Patagioenas fasciata monilis]|uniref:Uncharacterized protein n=1 Tax=Patagioenas fasciata monilis TaxID=372326 RepID=A0A1V4JTA9_PATFA|nr:hypothetical protein AV530_018440 [Patagioenas fasciata monilis]
MNVDYHVVSQQWAARQNASFPLHRNAESMRRDPGHGKVDFPVPNTILSAASKNSNVNQARFYRYCSMKSLPTAEISLL